MSFKIKYFMTVLIVFFLQGCAIQSYEKFTDVFPQKFSSIEVVINIPQRDILKQVHIPNNNTNSMMPYYAAQHGALGIGAGILMGAAIEAQVTESARLANQEVSSLKKTVYTEKVIEQLKHEITLENNKFVNLPNASFSYTQEDAQSLIDKYRNVSNNYPLMLITIFYGISPKYEIFEIEAYIQAFSANQHIAEDNSAQPFYKNKVVYQSKHYKSGLRRITEEEVKLETQKINERYKKLIATYPDKKHVIRKKWKEKLYNVDVKLFPIDNSNAMGQFWKLNNGIEMERLLNEGIKEIVNLLIIDLNGYRALSARNEHIQVLEHDWRGAHIETRDAIIWDKFKSDDRKIVRMVGGDLDGFLYSINKTSPVYLRGESGFILDP